MSPCAAMHSQATAKKEIDVRDDLVIAPSINGECKHNGIYDLNRNQTRRESFGGRKPPIRKRTDERDQTEKFRRREMK